MIGNHGYMAQFDLSDQTPDLTYERYAPKYDFRSVASEGYKIYLGSKGGTLLELALDGRGVPQNNMLPFPKKLIWKSETKEDGIFSITEILPVTGGGYAPFILAAANSLVFINQGSDRFVQFDEQDLFFTKQAPGLFKFAYQYQSDSSLLLVGTSLHQGKLVTGVYNYRFDPVKEEWRLLLGIPEFDQFFFDTTESICKPIMLTSGFFGYAYGHDDEGIYYLKTAYLNSNNNILEQFQLPVGTSELHTTHFDTKLKELFVGEVNGRLTGFLVGYPKTVLDKNKLETKQIARIKPKLLYERYLLEGLEFQGRETQALKAGSSRAYAASLSNFLAQNENIHIVLDAHAGGKGDDSNEETINRALTFRDMMVEYHPQIKNRIRCENKYDYYPVNRDSDNIINRTIIFRIEKF
ncbi:MAG TPA: hypothetical protein DCR93_04850 [Cytophagales bacterium]|nr:hypothetical protein [Cytophagales bacterium]